VRLDHAGRRRHRQRLGRRDAGGMHDVLGELFRPFDPSGRAVRAEHRYACVPKPIRDACDERCLGTDHDEIDVERAREHEEPLAVLRTYRMAGAEPCDPGVAGDSMKLVQCRRLDEFPGECVLTSTRPDQKHLHAANLPARSEGWKVLVAAKGWAMEEPGLDRHEWESEWQAREDQPADAPREALSELDNLVARILDERGYAISAPVARKGDEPEAVAEFLAAREATRL